MVSGTNLGVLFAHVSEQVMDQFVDKSPWGVDASDELMDHLEPGVDVNAQRWAGPGWWPGHCSGGTAVSAPRESSCWTCGRWRETCLHQRVHSLPVLHVAMATYKREHRNE